METLTPFSCLETFQRLDDYLDRELSAEELARVEEHLAVCANCAREFAFEATVLEDVRHKLRRIVAPEGLLARIAARLSEAGQA